MALSMQQVPAALGDRENVPEKLPEEWVPYVAGALVLAGLYWAFFRK